MPQRKDQIFRRFQLRDLAILSLLFGFFLVFSYVQRVDADSATSRFLTISYDWSGPIFSEVSFAPGSSVKKTVEVTNNGSEPHSFSIATKNVRGEVSKKMLLSVYVDGEEKLSKTIHDLIQTTSDQSYLIYSGIPSGGSISADFNVLFLADTGNEYQNKQVSFDFVFGSEEGGGQDQFFEESIASSNQSTIALSLLRSPLPVLATLNSISSQSPEPSSPAISQNETVGRVEGESSSKGILRWNPWYLLVAPAGVAVSAIFLPEFGFTALMTVAYGGATYVLGSRSVGDMTTKIFIIILVSEIILLFILCYLFLKHENRVSRKIRSHKHRLRLR